MNQIIEELVQISLHNPFPFIAIALATFVFGLVTRLAVLSLLVIGMLALLTQPEIRLGMSPSVQDALRAFHIAMVVSFISFGLGAIVRTLRG